MGVKHEKTPTTPKELRDFAEALEAIAVRFREASQLLDTAKVATAGIRNKSARELALETLQISSEKAKADAEGCHQRQVG